MAKGRIIVRLINKKTGSFYTTTVDPKDPKGNGKLKRRKYDPKTRRCEIFVQSKA